MYQQVYIACETSVATQQQIQAMKDYISWLYPYFTPRNTPHVTLRFLWEASDEMIVSNVENIKSVINDYSDDRENFCSTTYSYIKFQYRPQFEKGYISLEPFLPTMTVGIKNLMEKFIGRQTTPHITLGTINASSVDFIAWDHKRELVQMVQRDTMTADTSVLVVKGTVDGEEYKIIETYPL